MVWLTGATCILLVAGVKAPAAEKVVDQGTFVITVGGRRAGQEAFSIVEVGKEREIRTTTVLAGPLGPTRVRGKLRTDERWQPLRGQFEVQATGASKRIVLDREGGFPALQVRTGASSMVSTRPGRSSDLFVLNQSTVIAHLSPICPMASGREQTLIAFPAAPLRLSPATVRPYPQSRLGAPALDLRTVIVDLARSARFEVVCDGPRLIAVHQMGRRLTAVRASYEAVASTLDARAPAKPATPADLVELPRRLAVGAAAPLGCVLTAPRDHRAAGKASTRPAVVLVGDSDFQDRDGDPVGPGDLNFSLLRRLAARLGEGGVISLRCDDRGVAARSPRPANVGLTTLAADVRAMLALLRKEPGVDPARMAVIGQGEGGLVAALVAEREPRLKGIALLGTAGRPLDAVVLEQSEATLQRFGYPPPEIAAAVAEQRSAYDALRRGAALPATLSPAERHGLLNARPWLLSHLASDPAAVMGRLRLPVLIVQGEKDARLSRADFERLRDAARTNQHVTARLYPDLSHPFARAASDSLNDYLDPRAEVSETVLGDVLAFVSGAVDPAGLVAAQAQPGSDAHAP
jgi:dienelactone hydrolase